MDREAPSTTRPPPATPGDVGSSRPLNALNTIAPVAPPSVSLTQTIDEDTLPLLDAELVKMKLMPLSQRALGESRVLEYEAVEMNIHQPKLNLLGEGTSSSILFPLVCPPSNLTCLPQRRPRSSGLACSAHASPPGSTQA